jgi:sec-independent protein translocase protein TatA
MGPEWIVVGVIVIVVIFGAKKLPEMARSVGRAQGEFKKGLKEGDQPDVAGTRDDTAPQAQSKAETQD